MAASKASLAHRPTDLPGALPKVPRGLSFDHADRSSIRALSQASPLPLEPSGERAIPIASNEADPEAEIDTLLFHRDDPDLEELSGRLSRRGYRADPDTWRGSFVA